MSDRGEELQHVLGSFKSKFVVFLHFGLSPDLKEVLKIRLLIKY